MKTSVRTSDIESKPAATRSVSGVTATSGAKTSRCRKDWSRVSISGIGIMLGGHIRPANLTRGGGAGQGADAVQAHGNFIVGEVRAAKGADGIQVRLGLFQHK